jgi:hypothetical protein
VAFSYPLLLLTETLKHQVNDPIPFQVSFCINIFCYHFDSFLAIEDVLGLQFVAGNSSRGVEFTRIIFWSRHLRTEKEFVFVIQVLIEKVYLFACYENNRQLL